jgi:hypothetical protein
MTSWLQTYDWVPLDTSGRILDDEFHGSQEELVRRIVPRLTDGYRIVMQNTVLFVQDGPGFGGPIETLCVTFTGGPQGLQHWIPRPAPRGV